MDYYLRLGGTCNNNCFFCSSIEWTLPYKRGLEEVKQDIKEAVKKGFDNFVICRGEPTIREDFFDILDYIKKSNAKIRIVTNGRMFAYKDFTKKVLRYSNSFSFSLFGHNAALHDSITGVEGSFNQTIDGIKNILENKNNADLELITVANVLNKGGLLEIAKTANSLNIKSIDLFIPEQVTEEKIIPKIGDFIENLIEMYEYCRNNKIKLSINNISKNLRYILNYYNFISTGKPYHFRVDLHPVSGCNSQCIICDNWKNKIKAKYNKDKIISLIDELASFGIKELRFHGQEPTLRKDLIELIEYAKKKGLFVGLKTNCNLINENYAKKLANTGIDVVYVSIDSAIPAIHNKIRGNKESFDSNKRAVNFLKKFSGSKIKIFSNTVVTNLNYTELDKMLDLARALKIEKASFVQLNSKNKKDIGNLRLSKNQLQEFFFDVVPAIINKSIKYGIPVSFSPIFAELVNEKPEVIIKGLREHKERFVEEIDEYSKGEYGKTFYEKYGCYGPLDHATISPEGGVFSCCVMPRKRELAKGDISNERFKDIWDKEDYKKIRKEHANCKFYYDCGSNLSSRKAISSFLNSEKIINNFANPQDYLSYLDKIFFMPRIRLESLQFKKIKKILFFAYLNIPFYKQVLDKRGIFPSDIKTIKDFSRIPITTKDSVRKNFPHNLVLNDSKQEIIFESTSGSSMDKVDFARARNSERFLKKIFSYACVSDFRLSEPYAVFTTPHCSSEFCQARYERDPPNYVNEIILPTQINIMNSSDEAIKERINILKESKAKVLHADPFYLKAMVLYSKRNSIELPKLNMISSTYELLTKKTKELFEEEFGCKVFDEYGCSEIGPIAFSCEKGNKHIFSDSVFVEILPLENSKLGKIIVTDMDNYVMPFIRYETGDVGLIKKEKCTCGRSTPIIEVHGRLDECVKVGDKIITPKEFAESIEKIEGIDFYQALIKDIKNIQIKILRNDKWLKQSEDRVNSVIKKLFWKGAKICIEFVKGVVTETSGKFKILKITPELRIK